MPPTVNHRPFPVQPNSPANTAVSRRSVLVSSIAGLASALTARCLGAGEGPAGAESVVRRGRIRQSIMGWCFQPMPVEELARHCKAIGLVAMEGISHTAYPSVRELGLKISLVGSHGFGKGPFDRENHAFCIEKLREGIDRCVEFGCQNVITFTGMRAPGISDEQGAANCVECWKQVIGYAEQKQVNLCLEHLNTRDSTHPMKGHPGYFGDNVDLCIDLIKRVGSERMKLLFDIYHVQIMHGDVIRRIRQYHPYIAHYHTAGVPGRGELDDTQEINYPAVMKAILETGYQGFVAQEFIPTWPDKLAALRHAAGVCDV
jgi:hydroxypyruvate isomerase